MLEIEADASPLIIRFFGANKIVTNGQTVKLRDSRAYELLALLVLHQGREVTRELIIGELWPDTDEVKARDNLSHYLSGLRGALGYQVDRLQVPTSQTIRLDLTNAFVDILAFDKYACQDDINSLKEAVLLYQESQRKIVSLYWQQDLRARHTTYLSTLEKISLRYTEIHDHVEAKRHLELLIFKDSTRESAYRALMEVYAAQGEIAAVTQTFRQLRLLFHKELQSDVSSETKELYTRLLAELRDHSQRRKQSALHLYGLPAEMIGREKEITEISSLIDSSRLVTLTGGGGIGKTRLAIAVAEKLKSSFSDDLWFIDLSSVSEARLIPQAVPTALSISEESNRLLMDTLVEWLADKQILLILDNCDHHVKACADFARGLLGSTSRVKILTTNRFQLHLSFEKVFLVPPLAVPDLPKGRHTNAETTSNISAWSNCESTRLFVMRAMETSEAFVLQGKDALTVAQICRKLDGIALAIELAASLVNVLSLKQILERLNRRFALLRNYKHDAAHHHESLQVMIDWTYAIISGPEKRLFRLLSVFAGTFSLEAVTKVCELDEYDAIDSLRRLIDRRLLQSVESAEETKRYRLLETYRLYGRELLETTGEANNIWSRYCAYFEQRIQEAESHLSAGQDLPLWLQQLEDAKEDIRVILAQYDTGEGEADRGLRVAITLFWFWINRGYITEGREWLTRLQKRNGIKLSTQLAALQNSGNFAMIQNDYRAALSLFLEALAISESLNAPDKTAQLRASLGTLYSMMGDYENSRTYLASVLPYFQALPEREGEVTVLLNLGNLEYRQKKYLEAESYWNQAFSLSTNPISRMEISNNLGTVNFDMDNIKSAIGWFIKSFNLCYEQDDAYNIYFVIEGLAAVACRQGDYIRSATLYAASDVQIADLGIAREPAAEGHRVAIIEVIQKHVSEEDFLRATEVGRQMSREDIFAFVRDGFIPSMS